MHASKRRRKYRSDPTGCLCCCRCCCRPFLRCGACFLDFRRKIYIPLGQILFDGLLMVGQVPGMEGEGGMRAGGGRKKMRKRELGLG